MEVIGGAAALSGDFFKRKAGAGDGDEPTSVGGRSDALAAPGIPHRAATSCHGRAQRSILRRASRAVPEPGSAAPQARFIPFSWSGLKCFVAVLRGSSRLIPRLSGER